MKTKVAKAKVVVFILLDFFLISHSCVMFLASVF